MPPVSKNNLSVPQLLAMRADIDKQLLARKAELQAQLQAAQERLLALWNGVICDCTLPHEVDQWQCN